MIFFPSEAIFINTWSLPGSFLNLKDCFALSVGRGSSPRRLRQHTTILVDTGSSPQSNERRTDVYLQYVLCRQKENNTWD